MSKLRILSKLIIPFTLLLIYGATLYKTAAESTLPVLKIKSQIAHIHTSAATHPVKVIPASPPLPLLEDQDNLPLPSDTVLGVIAGGQARAYVLIDFPSALNILNEMLGGQPIVLLIDNQNYFTAGFNAQVKGQRLIFKWEGKTLQDQTGSTWDLSGKAFSGTLAGQQLQPVPFTIVTWQQWQTDHPDTFIYGR